MIRSFVSPPLFAELKRRRVFRALVGYGLAAFAVLQIIEPLMHGLRWPDEALSYVVGALALGFPLVVALAWAFDVKEGRIERTGPAPGLRGARLAGLLAGVGLLAAAPGVAWYLYFRPRAPEAAGMTRAALEAVPPASDIRSLPSIAVLPLVNPSRDPEQIQAFRGDRESAFQWLERGLKVQDAGMRYVKRDPFLASLHGDRRFADLLRRMKLPVD